MRNVLIITRGNEMSSNLVNIVTDLISRKHEGDYWDFKETHHENKADLLHDIICLSNNLFIQT